MGFESKYLALSALAIEEEGLYKNWRSGYNTLYSATAQEPIK